MRTDFVNERSADLSAAIAGRIFRVLEWEGYKVLAGEIQSGGAKFSLHREDLDGTVVLFLEPVDSAPNGDWLLRYQLVWEHTLNETVRQSANATLEQMTNAFVTRLETVLHEKLQLRREPSAGVGLGLVSPAVAEEDARAREELAR